jgi:hypothetical protein
VATELVGTSITSTIALEFVPAIQAALQHPSTVHRKFFDGLLHGYVGCEIDAARARGLPRGGHGAGADVAGADAGLVRGPGHALPLSRRLRATFTAMSRKRGRVWIARRYSPIGRDVSRRIAEQRP